MAKGFFRHHEPLPTPERWNEEEKRFSVKLEQVLDDIYQRFGKIRIKDLDDDARARLQEIYDHGGVQSVNGQTGNVAFKIQDADADENGNFDLLDKIYPVGSIYMSVNSTSPASFIGGTWERITGRFLLAATDEGNSGASQAAGNTGGAATVTLGTGNIPKFTGSVVAGGGTTGSSGGGYGAFREASGVFSVASNQYQYARAKGSYAESWPDNTRGRGQINLSFGSDSPTAINKMPPYLSVYVWKRTA